MKCTGMFLLIFTLFTTLSSQSDRYLSLRKNMIETQIFERGITDQRILDAFLNVKRHLFVRQDLRTHAYSDRQLSIGEGQTMNKPYIVAIITQVIEPDANKKVLEIGTGSGYHAAILAELFKEVFTIEIKAGLARKAMKLLKTLNYSNIRFKIGDGYNGWQEHAPYDCIIATSSIDHIPEPLIKQLANGGRMVIPVSYSSEVQELILIEKKKDGTLKKINLIPVLFVPFIRGGNAR